MGSILHLVCSFIIANTIYQLEVLLLKYDRIRAIRYSFNLTLIVGIGKEIYDIAIKGSRWTSSLPDLTFDFVGAVLFLTVYIYIMDKK
jgi:uncharacterized protein YfiM (DUF2279 family)